MQQHPIPQNVTAYEFHLIGNMTIKQFLEVGAGVGVALLFYSTNLPAIIKWPLVGFSILVGAALAFMPFDGRPLDRMVIVFIKAVYSPTQYIWRKDARIPSFFSFVKSAPGQVDLLEIEKQKVRKNLNEYLSTLPSVPSNDLDDYENKFIYSIDTLFNTTPAAQQVTESTDLVNFKQSPKVRVRKLKPLEDISHEAKDDIAETIKANSSPIQTVPVAPTPPLQNSTVPNLEPAQQQPYSTSHAQNPTPINTTQAVHNKNLPFPALPESPNTLVGMVLDNQGKIIENAIIEVRDENHMPIRALKSNKLGQFFSATQLKNGDYEIEAEKDGYKFDIVTLKLTGEIVHPLEIKSQNSIS